MSDIAIAGVSVVNNSLHDTTNFPWNPSILVFHTPWIHTSLMELSLQRGDAELESSQLPLEPFYSCVTHALEPYQPYGAIPA